MIFRLHTVYNKHEMIKIGNQIREKHQVLFLVIKVGAQCLVYTKGMENAFV